MVASPEVGPGTRSSRGYCPGMHEVEAAGGDGTTQIVRLIGVYDADGTLRGELAYFIGARLGRAHCSLCDITHGLVRAKPQWQRGRDALPVPFDTFHRDDQPEAVRVATGDAAPVVVAETGAGIVPLLDDAALVACDGSVDALLDAVRAAADAHRLTWPRA